MINLEANLKTEQEKHRGVYAPGQVFSAETFTTPSPSQHFIRQPSHVLEPPPVTVLQLEGMQQQQQAGTQFLQPQSPVTGSITIPTVTDLASCLGFSPYNSGSVHGGYPSNTGECFYHQTVDRLGRPCLKRVRLM